MDTLPNYPNGFVYYTEQDIANRQFLIDDISARLRTRFKQANRVIDFIRVETPCLVTPEIVNDHLESKFPLWSASADQQESTHNQPSDCPLWYDGCNCDSNMWLRPESTKGTYAMFDVLFPQELQFKKQLPVCLWQSGLSFRIEQDKTFRHLRFKQFYQLEFQLAYSETTKDDYHTIAADVMQKFLEDRFQPLVARREYLKPEEKPFYSLETADLYLSNASESWEVVAISKRKDFRVPIVEISCGLDRLTYLFQRANQ